MVRRARDQLLLLVFDGVLGAMIGCASVGSLSAASVMARDRVPMYFIGTSVTAVMFAIPMFIATVALAPALLAALRVWSRQPAWHYYLKSALAGVVFGVVACAAVGFVFGLVVPFLPREGGVALTERLMALVGAPLYLAIGFFFSAFLFWWQILIAGIMFGLLNGWWLRRH